ncbi:MAG TPA: DNA translocase FtsK 4TM domain-containing protein, partial [Candidatus Limnocylindria bacterium]|nr:DNA translocase FtsK 4TM domain-containing protein [Candidatus Limnocylindria bacterium]
MSARRASRRQPQRGAVALVEPRIRNEVGAIALVAFALLSMVALVADQGAVLHWWRSFLVALVGWGAFAVPFLLGAIAAELWFGLVKRGAAIPIAGGLVVFVALLALAQHYQDGDPAAGEGAGGVVGSAIAGAASGAFGDVGGPIVLVTLLLLGIVVAGNRTLSDLVRPIWTRRAVLRTGMSLPAGTATRFGREVEVPDAEGSETPVRINLPPERPAKAEAAKPQLRLLPPPAEPGTDEASAPDGAFTPSIAGLPDKTVAVEGVLNAKADRAWTLPPLDLLGAGDHGHAGSEKDIQRSIDVIEQTLAHFSITAKVVEATVGPVVTRYELKPAPGVKLSRIEALNDDLALALAARTLRIEAPIPGKSVVGIEVPNLAVGLVSLRD